MLLTTTTITPANSCTIMKRRRKLVVITSSWWHQAFHLLSVICGSGTSTSARHILAAVCLCTMLLAMSSCGEVRGMLDDDDELRGGPLAPKKKKLKEQDIIQRVLKDYDWRVRPRGNNDTWPDTGGPVLVSVNIYLRSISKIDDVNMEYSAQFTFREEWWDARLAYERFADEHTEVPPFVVLATSEQADLSQQIWMPDTFFQNEKEARRHLIDKPNVLIRIHKNGQILYSVRLSLVLSCPMSLEYYPLDRQTCLIDLASYAYTTDDIKYEWKKANPVQQKDGLRQSLPSFELQDVLTDYCTSKTNTGEYSCLRTKMILRREFSYYLLQLYIPSFMLVIVSWVSFWLDKDSVPARVTLGVTTLLTMTTQSSGINAKLPPVSYTKAVDVWIGVCMAFIFGALLEFALVNYAARKDITTSQHRMLKMHTSATAAAAAAAAAASNDQQQQYPNQQQPAVDDGLPAFTHGYQPLILPPPLNAAQNQHPQHHHHHTHHQRYSSGGLNAAVSSQQSAHRHIHGGHRHGGGGSWYPFCCRIFVRRYKERSKRIDVVSRLVFPIGYACFNVLYWAVYLIYYLIQLYIPSLMLVVVSWVSFWLDKDAVPARVSLGVTTLLTMTTQASGINSKLPPVSYIKAVDVWIGSCLAFIFSALLEYALVNYCGRREFVKKEKGKTTGGLLNFPLMSSPNDCLCPPPLSPLTPYNVGGGEQLKEINNNINNNNCYTTDETTTYNNFNNFSSIRLDTTCLSSNVTGSGECHNAAFTARPPSVPSVAKARPPTGSSFSSAIRKRRPALCPCLRCPTITRLELSKRVDITSRFTFPALFFLFLVFYYLVYVYNNELMHAEELILKP